jgi:hypothetical protein
VSDEEESWCVGRISAACKKEWGLEGLTVTSGVGGIGPDVHQRLPHPAQRDTSTDTDRARRGGGKSFGSAPQDGITRDTSR